MLLSEKRRCHGSDEWLRVCIGCVVVVATDAWEISMYQDGSGQMAKLVVPCNLKFRARTRRATISSPCR
ncbi:hypothetical protein WN48_03193 [Eufriesea mexicana]|nr:hypothetical protein WN48_03193 [Eufriesea mexicana]